MEETYIDSRDRRAQFDRALARFKQDGNISPRNKELVLSFVRDAELGKTVIGKAKKKIGVARLLSYLGQLQHVIAALPKDLDQVTQRDMEEFVHALESGAIHSRHQHHHKQALSERYKVDVKITVKKFYKWLWGNCRTYPSVVEWIDTFAKPNEVSALTEAEVGRLMDLCRSVEVRALIQVLFDGGLRIGELLNVRLRHVWLRPLDPQRPDHRLFIVRVPFSKTLRRTVVLPMPATTKWLSLWLEQHPARPKVRADGTFDASDVSAPLFPTTENAVRLALRYWGRKALGKRVYPHLLRHTSATYWSNKLPYFKLCKRFGWSMTSNMPQRYIDREGVDELDVVKIYQESERGRPVEDRVPRSPAQHHPKDDVTNGDNAGRYREWREGSNASRARPDAQDHWSERTTTDQDGPVGDRWPAESEDDTPTRNSRSPLGAEWTNSASNSTARRDYRRTS